MSAVLCKQCYHSKPIIPLDLGKILFRVTVAIFSASPSSHLIESKARLQLNTIRVQTLVLMCKTSGNWSQLRRNWTHFPPVSIAVIRDLLCGVWYAFTSPSSELLINSLQECTLHSQHSSLPLLGHLASSYKIGWVATADKAPFESNDELTENEPRAIWKIKQVYSNFSLLIGSFTGFYISGNWSSWVSFYTYKTVVRYCMRQKDDRIHIYDKTASKLCLDIIFFILIWPTIPNSVFTHCVCSVLTSAWADKILPPDLNGPKTHLTHLTEGCGEASLT